RLPALRPLLPYPAPFRSLVLRVDLLPERGDLELRFALASADRAELHPLEVVAVGPSPEDLERLLGLRVGGEVELGTGLAEEPRADRKRARLNCSHERIPY